MSEVINNREYRQKVLKELILELHKGKTVEEIKPRFEKLIQGISTAEIAEMEQSLIMEGMPVEELQRLCDVHAAVLKGLIEEIHRPKKIEETPGHPVYIFKQENRELERLIRDRIEPHIKSFRESDDKENLNRLKQDFEALWEIDKHFSRKENLLFPYMEKYGITAPPKVMWGVDDEIRVEIKDVRQMLSDYNGNREQIVEKAKNAASKVTEMIFKEESILFPMVLETLSEDEWLKISEESKEIGFCLIEPKDTWKPERVSVEAKAREQAKERMNEHGSNTLKEGYVKFATGVLLPEEIEAMLNTLPLDITFVDKDGAVKYFSQGKERIFARTKAVIGRQVQNCHPPASVHVVEKIVEDLKTGKKDHEDFWIKMGDKYVYIRYFAVRNEKGEYLGVLEVTQNIKPIQEITGEKRLVSD